MHRALRTLAAAATIALSSALAACGEDPAGTTAAPSRALQNGGATFGSGSYWGDDDGQNTTAADSGSTARGGATFGSGS